MFGLNRDSRYVDSSLGSNQFVVEIVTIDDYKKPSGLMEL
jgi:hypothetical protein